MKLMYFLLLMLVIGTVYVRLAGSDPGRWHVDPLLAENPGKRGDLRRFPGDLSALDRIIRAEPRARILAGDLKAGHVTYVVRSRLFGFPDYVSVMQDGPDLVVFSRLRFGANDVGVNAARLDRWFEQL